MPTLWLLDIEAHQQRYTGEWRDHLPALLQRAAAERGQGGWSVRVISGEAGEQVPTPGAFLNFAATNIYKSSQIITMARAFERGEVKVGDKILVTDAWHPGIIQLRYMANLLGVPVEIHGMWHAGGYDPHDFLGRLIADKRWSNAFESALFYALDVNHYATQFHIDLFKQTFGAADDGRICLTGWPMEYLRAVLTPAQPVVKERLVLFPHRLAPEKQVEIFRDLAAAFPDYRFVVAQDQALTKPEYHALLQRAALVFSVNLQETLGISLYEGALCGAMPLAPARLSYVEMYSPEWLYPSDWTTDWSAYQQYRHRLVARMRSMLNDFWRHPAVVQKQIAAQASSLEREFFTAAPLYDRLFLDR